jgi:hypothetical protein
MFRSLDGQFRIDTGNFSIINNPLANLRIILDHLAMEARILVSPGMPGMPGVPPLPAGIAADLALAMAAAGAAAQLIQLGKSFIAGQAVQGIRYNFPAIPGASLTSWEQWTSIKLGLPVMTQTIGAFGQSIMMCGCTGIAPPPTMFQIPPGYNVINPSGAALPPIASAPPVVPTLPVVPQIPVSAGFPILPAVPSAPIPTMPNAPVMPSAPNLSATPQIPTLPSAPAAPVQNIPSTPTLTPKIPKLPGMG